MNYRLGYQYQRPTRNITNLRSNAAWHVQQPCFYTFHLVNATSRFGRSLAMLSHQQANVYIIEMRAAVRYVPASSYQYVICRGLIHQDRVQSHLPNLA